MWRKLALLLVVGLAATASAQDAASAPAAPAQGLDDIPFLEIPVKIADTRVDLGLFEGDNVNEAVEKFGRDNSLNADDLATLKAEVTRRLVSIAEAVTKNIQQSKQSKEPLFEFPVSLDDGEVAVADARRRGSDETLPGAGLVDLDVFEFERGIVGPHDRCSHDIPFCPGPGLCSAKLRPSRSPLGWQCRRVPRRSAR